jgi:alginate O-acetyltransferase complex protein AlgI
MVFSSEVFLFLFLPIFLIVYYLTPARWRSPVILVASYIFYGWWRLDFVALLFGITLWSYGFGLLVGRNLGTARGTQFLTIGIIGNLIVLGIFKYLNFFIDSFAALVGTDAAGLGIEWRILLPIGVSFFVFHSISYLVDVYRRDVPATVRFFDFAAFIALFPHLVAGPILRFKELAHQFEHRTHSAAQFADGLARFTIGLGKKVILADAVAPIADLAFATDNPTMALAWLGAVAYMLQLYFDFSGYSDMAIGLAKMIGFRFPENFDTPYISRSITEFWRRWHISLSIWLRDYLYIPLGGNRLGEARTYVNLMTVMVLGGLWHGANWTFLAWGAWHGVWLAAERALGWNKASSTAALVRTLLVVLVGWVAFRAHSMGEAFDVYGGMLGFHGFAIPLDIAVQITQESLILFVLAMVVVALEPRLNAWAKQGYFPDDAVPNGNGALTAVNSVLPALGLATIAVLSLMKLAENSFSPFLYFQF